MDTEQLGIWGKSAAKNKPQSIRIAEIDYSEARQACLAR